MADDSRKPIGEILKGMDKIADSHINEVLDEQKIFAKRFGEILIEKGLATPDDIMQALSLQLQPDTPHVQAAPASFMDKLRGARFTISFKLSIIITLTIILIMAVSSYFHFNNQRAEFTKQMEAFGAAAVSSLARNSSVAFLEKDDASLNILMADISKLKDIVYAMVLDKNGIIKAHIDMQKIDQQYTPIKSSEQPQKLDDLIIQKYREKNREILDFSKAIMFNNVLIGSIHIGLSLETLERNIERTRLHVIMLTVGLSAMGIIFSLIIGTNFSRPILKLVKGTEEIKEGNFDYRIAGSRNDELGDLTIAFNDMADGLMKKEVIQDAFGRYVTPEIVEMILKNPDQKWLKGKKINATIMFADIRGFTSFSEKTAPEDVVHVLNDHFTMTTDIVLKYGGHIDKFIGDEVLAVFGALVEQEDHAARAVKAAVTLQNALKSRNESLGAQDTPLHVGIGINSGELVSGNIGSKKRMEYTVIGDTVNLASRLTRLAGPDEIVVSEFVYKEISGKAEAEKLEPVMVKGKADPVQTYKVRGMDLA